jgi:hypothetical protein
MLDDDLVEKLHGMLAEALHRVRPEPFAAPVTVAEMYQDLVPYRSVRTALGFQMNADYEHTLLRLLAGEGGYARLEPAEARSELTAELDTPNPNVGLFRKFAACDVWITPAAVPAGLPGFSPQSVAPAPAKPAPTPPPAAAPPAAPKPVPPVAAAPPPPPVSMPLVDVQPRAEPPAWSEPNSTPAERWDAIDEEELLLEEEVETPDTAVELPARLPPTTEQTQAPMFETKASHASVAESATSGSCAFCRTALPSGRKVRFCPFCGADQTMKPCGSCREALDPAWTFCIACGSRQS